MHFSCKDATNHAHWRMANRGSTIWADCSINAVCVNIFKSLGMKEVRICNGKLFYRCSKEIPEVQLKCIDECIYIAVPSVPSRHARGAFLEPLQKRQCDLGTKIPWDVACAAYIGYSKTNTCICWIKRSRAMNVPDRPTPALQWTTIGLWASVETRSRNDRTKRINVVGGSGTPKSGHVLKWKWRIILLDSP